MAYDKNIPTVLQLLRTGDIDGTTIARYSIDGDYSPRYFIFDALDDIDTMDIEAAIEETMHAILDNGGTPDDLYSTMGLVLESDIDPDTIESGEYTPIDLGYCLPGQLTSIEELSASEIDIQQAFDAKHIENIQTAFWNVATGNRLPVTRLMASHDFTEWQAFEVCKAADMNPAILSPAALDLIANENLNHAQMRELRHIAVHTDFADHDASPYKKDVFKTLSNGEYTAEHLHQARELMKTTAIHDIAFPRDWLKLDSRQMEVVRHALKSDVPMDALEEYADGTYTADHMNVITMALTEGMEKPEIERLMNHDLSMEQVWGFYSAISGGRFTSEQLDVLCDPTRPVAVMEAMRTGLTFGVDTQTVLRLADGSFAPEQMESLYLAAGDKDITPEMLDVIADASLKPEQMDALKISFQQGGSIADVESEKKSMPRSVKYAGQAGKADAIHSTKLHETAKESREASAQLGSESHDDKAVEREELE